MRVDRWVQQDEQGSRYAEIPVHAPREVKIDGVWNAVDVVVVDKELFYELLNAQGFTQVGKHAPLDAAP